VAEKSFLDLAEKVIQQGKQNEKQAKYQVLKCFMYSITC